MPSTLDSLLQTKLHPPHLIGPTVPRPTLLARLHQGLEAPFTLICAPAGYGKTSLAIQWLESINQPVTWVSLDEDDVDLAEFVGYLVATIQLVEPGGMTSTEALLRLPQMPQPNRMAKVFLQDLEALPHRIVLVLDDYHTAEAPATQAFMSRVLQAGPRQLHVLMITRTDPILPLARLRSITRFVEIRNADLRFDAAEAALLIQQTVGAPIGDELLHQLETRTEGWAVGLKLAAVLLRETEDQDAFARQFAAHSHEWIMEYLLDEGLAALDDVHRTHLLRTALFDRFSADLLQFVLEPDVEPGTGTAIVDTLVQANLFLFPLDDQGIWYRFHHLFQELLLHRLRKLVPLEERQAVLHKAAIWHGRQGMVEEAIRYAVAAGDLSQATQLVEDNLNLALNNEDWRRVDRWLHQLPVAAIDGSVGSLMASAMMEHFRHRIAATSAQLDKAEALAAHARQSDSLSVARQSQLDHWLGAIYTIRSQQEHLADETESSLWFAAKALEKLPDEWIYMRSLAELYRITGLQQAGRMDDAVRYARSRLEQTSTSSGPFSLRILLGLGGIHYAEANPAAMEKVAYPYLAMAQKLGRSLSIGWAYFLLGWAYYQQNRLRQAEESFRAVLNIRQLIHQRATIDSYTGLALTLTAQGRTSEAMATVEEFHHYLTELGSVSLTPLSDSLRMRLSAMHGAQGTTPSVRDIQHQLRTDLLEIPALTAVRVMLANGELERMTEAGEILAVAAAWATERHSVRCLIEVNLLSIMRYVVLGESESALAELGRTVSLAKPGGVKRAFVEMGIALRPYLTMLLKRNFERAFVQEILAAYAPYPLPAAPDLPAKNSPNEKNGLPAREQVEAELTHRERDVLILLAEKRSNAEIAAALTVTLPTVKKHARNIYRKLHVNNRREAVARARMLGLLSSAEEYSF